jgi:hypothetical protein
MGAITIFSATGWIRGVSLSEYIIRHATQGAAGGRGAFAKFPRCPLPSSPTPPPLCTNLKIPGFQNVYSF